MLQEGPQDTRRGGGAGRRGTFYTALQFPGLCQHQTLGAHPPVVVGHLRGCTRLISSKWQGTPSSTCFILPFSCIP